MPPYVLKEVTTKPDFDATFDVIWTAFYNPYLPYISIFMPVFGPTSADREVAIKESKARYWEEHTSTPASHWFSVTHSASGRVVGAAQWVLHESNPFAEGAPDLTAVWWPEGEGREYCTRALEQIFGYRARWMQRAHTALNIMAVDPAHRSRGVGRMLMDWGIEQARERNIESVLEATEGGQPLYAKYGYGVLHKLALNTAKPDASDMWRKLQHELGPFTWYVMWRPASGAYEEGKTALPWERLE